MMWQIKEDDNWFKQTKYWLYLVCEWVKEGMRQLENKQNTESDILRFENDNNVWWCET